MAFVSSHVGMKNSLNAKKKLTSTESNIRRDRTKQSASLKESAFSIIIIWDVSLHFTTGLYDIYLVQANVPSYIKQTYNRTI